MDMEPGKEGGMQLGFITKPSKNGKPKRHCVGVLLNLPCDPMSNPSGRGRLVRNYLEYQQEFPEYVEDLELQHYMGFTLVGVELRYDYKIISSTITVV